MLASKPTSVSPVVDELLKLTLNPLRVLETLAFEASVAEKAVSVVPFGFESVPVKFTPILGFNIPEGKVGARLIKAPLLAAAETLSIFPEYPVPVGPVKLINEPVVREEEEIFIAFEVVPVNT